MAKSKITKIEPIGKVLKSCGVLKIVVTKKDKKPNPAIMVDK